MRTKFWMLGLAVTALASCTNDEVVEVNESNLIQFESFVNKGTRAVTATTTPGTDTDGNATGLSKFYVFGYYGTNNTVFENVAVELKDGAWDYGTKVPWTNNTTYQFAAYATKNASEQLTDAKFESGKLTFSNFAVDDAKDLVIAYASNHTSGQDVALTFKHKLAKVKFTLTNASTDGLSMQVSDIKFKLVQTGSYDSSSANEWTASTTETETELTFGGTATSTYISAIDDANTTDVNENVYTTKEHLVLPQKLGTIKASFTASFFDNNKTLVETVNYSDVELGGETIDNTTDEYWKPGYVYNYTASLPVTPTYIKFTVTKVDEWEEGTGDTGTASATGSTGSVTF